MKFRKMISFIAAGTMLMTMPMVTDAATAGVSAGVSKKITANMNSDTTVSAGVSSALATCIDISTAKATVSAAEDTTTASGQQETVCAVSYTHLTLPTKRIV